MSISQLYKNDFLNPNLWDFYFIGDPDLRFLVKSTTLPFIKFETETRSTGDKFLKGYTSEEGFSITFKETRDNKIFKYFKAWEENIYDKQKRVFKNNSYVKTGILALSETTDTGDSYTIAFQFFDMVFLGFENMDWDYVSTEGKEIVCNFSVDSVEQTNKTVAFPTL